jgi:hypothetical protein
MMKDNLMRKLQDEIGKWKSNEECIMNNACPVECERRELFLQGNLLFGI